MRRGALSSFFSADAALTFASAGLICSHHTKLRLFGAADALTCVGSLAAAGTAAVLGVIGDAHYATDAITGAIVGSAVGFGVPYLHYKEARRPEDGNVAGRPHLDVHIVPTWNGASIRGRF